MPIDIEEYKKQIQEEFELIKEKGFIKYFLIVADLIQWAKSEGILIGCGRGSVTGSTIAYLLGITDIDAIVHKTNFSRFLNAGRGKDSMPDIDIDAPDNKREDLSNRLKTLYGSNSIAQLTTFLKIEERTAIRDVARVFDVPLKEADMFSKLIGDDDIETAMEKAEGRIFADRYPHVIKHALKLRGQYRSLGRHAAAQIISSEDLTLGTRASLADRNGAVAVSLDMEDAEYAGLLKLDLLSLSNLTVIADCLELIKQNHGKSIDLVNIDLTNKKIFKELSLSNTVGIFQFNTYAMSRLSKEMGIDSFSDMVAALALVRPGPMDSGMTAQYIQRKKTKTWDKKHDVFESITEDTYGINIFQEQVLEIFVQIAGLEPQVADKIRKVIGKKRDAAEFEPYRIQFIEGCKKVGYFSEKEADNFWRELQAYARYGFSKNHAVAYAKIAYDCCFLREYYSSEFLCSCLTYGSEGEKAKLLAEAQRLGLSILPPKIATSHPTKWEARDGILSIPFIEIKGLGQRSVETIAQYQQSLQPGFFTSEAPVIKGKLKTILDNIGAFTEEVPDTIDDYFPDLGISLKPKSKYKKLYELVGENTKWDSSKLLTGDFIGGHFGREISKSNPIPKLFSCTNCDLRNTNEIPVIPIVGKYNIAIVNEAPHWDQKPEKFLFKELQKYGFEKSDFYYTNLMKCACKKPSIENIKTCGEWLKQEIKEKKIFLILTQGSSNVTLFSNDDQGVMRKNGSCEWNEEYGCWVVYSIGANLALWKPEMKSKFEESIKLFVQKCEQLGGLV